MIALLLGLVLAQDPTDEPVDEGLLATPMLEEVAVVPVTAPEVREQIDWQGHPAMHIPWFMFGKGLTGRELRHRTWRHQFRQTVSARTLEDSGVRLVLAAAMAAERANNPRQARRLILRQLAFIEDFIAENPDQYTLARTPGEARDGLMNTDKTVFVHSIEGMHELLWDEGDAQFWADQGVALVTLIHLRDKELGGAAVLDKSVGPLINPVGAKRRRQDLPRGLTDLGRDSIVRLDAAGILVDYTHVSPESLRDALFVCEANGIPPILTHSVLAKARPDEFGITDEQLVQVYRLGGSFSMGLNAIDLRSDDAEMPVPEGVCPGTVEAWAWHHDLVQETLLEHVSTIFDDPDLRPETLSEAQRTQLSTGWSSDWNGWTSHSTPVAQCRPIDDPTPLEKRGLAHPGFLPAHWDAVQAQGVDLDPMLRSAERFLQLWEHVREDRPRH